MYLDLYISGTLVVIVLILNIFLHCHFVFLFTEKLFNIEVDIIFFIFLLYHVQFLAKFNAFLTIALGKRVSAKGLEDFGNKASRRPLLFFLTDD